MPAVVVARNGRKVAGEMIRAGRLYYGVQKSVPSSVHCHRPPATKAVSIIVKIQLMQRFFYGGDRCGWRRVPDAETPWLCVSSPSAGAVEAGVMVPLPVPRQTHSP